jgi:hypothetical protein
MRIFLLIMLGLQIAAATETGKVPLNISLSVPTLEVQRGGPIAYNITLINHTDRSVDYFELWAGFDTVYEITDMDGRRVPPLPARDWMGSIRKCELEPGEATSWGAALSQRDFPNLIPGKYQIRVSMENPDDPKGKKLYSNAVTVTILPSPTDATK